MALLTSTFIFCLVVTSVAKPNILVVVVDDLGYADLGLKDSSFSTPAIDTMAQEGVFLERFYTSPTCTPSRAQLMTGKYNFKIGMQDSVIHSTEPRGIPLEHEFLSNKLVNAGYQTAAIGKWHLGMHMPQYLPMERGFSKHYGIYTGGGDHYTHQSVSQVFTTRDTLTEQIFSGYNLWENGSVSDDNWRSIHSTTLYNDKAQQYIEEFLERPEPFFMYLAYQAVHTPVQTDPETVTNTSCKDIVYQDMYSNKTDLAERILLCGMMVQVDRGLQNIRDQLTAAGVWDNTVVVFMSDNGGKLSHGSCNYPLRGEKGKYFEGGVRVPAFFSGGYVTNTLQTAQASSLYSGLMHVTDIHSTLLDLAELPIAPDLDGVSHWGALTGATTTTPRSELVLNLNSDMWGGSGAIIVGDFKLIVNANPEEARIYSAVTDIMASSSIHEEWEILELVKQAAEEALSTSHYFLFNIVENPSEVEGDKHCADPTACNLWGMAAYQHVQTKLLARMDELRDEMILSSFTWADDGALANPDNFGGVWSPWRDELGAPYAQHTGLVSQLLRIGTLKYIADSVKDALRSPQGDNDKPFDLRPPQGADDKHGATSSNSFSTAAKQTSSSLNSTFGDSSTDVAFFSTVAVVLAAAFAVTASVAYNAGRRAAYSRLI